MDGLWPPVQVFIVKFDLKANLSLSCKVEPVGGVLWQGGDHAVRGGVGALRGKIILNIFLSPYFATHMGIST